VGAESVSYWLKNDNKIDDMAIDYKRKMFTNKVSALSCKLSLDYNAGSSTAKYPNE
jgi:hypothetical protein